MGLPVIDLARAKAHLRVEHDLDDVDIMLYAEAAVDRTLQAIGLAGCLGTHVDIVAALDSSFSFPVSAVSLVERDNDGVWEVMDPVDYLVAGNYDTGYRLVIKDPVRSRYRVRWDAGFADPVPAWFQIACLFLIAHYYENRSSVAVGVGVTVTQVPASFDHLVAPHRRFWFV